LHPYLILDGVDDSLTISTISDQDAIHAKKDDLPNIFKITYRKISSPKEMKTLYVLTKNQSEKNVFMQRISNLMRTVRSSIENGLMVRQREFVDLKVYFDSLF